jgi:GH24 family phage-related lysozyme (muramidase)
VAVGADVLKEFVVAIGFKVDENSVRKFTKTFDRVVTGLTAVAASVAAAGLAIATHVNKVSGNFEKMYYTAQRVGTTVKSLQEVQYAAQQIGVSADEVTSQINSLYMTLKRNPGTAGILAGIGVNAQETDSVKLYMDFLDKMQHLPDSTKIQMGDIFGQDAQTMLQIMRNPAQFRAKVEERRRMTEAAGVDPDEQARKAVEYQNALRKLNEQLMIFGGIIAEKLLPYMERLTTAAIGAVEWISKLDPKLLALITTIGGFLLILGALGTAIGAISAVLGPVVGIFTSLAGAIGSIGAAGGAAAAAGGTAAAGTAAAGGAAATSAIASVAAVVVPIVLGIIAALGIAYILKQTGVADAMQKWGEEHSVEKTWEKLKALLGGKQDERKAEAAEGSGKLEAFRSSIGKADEWWTEQQNKWTDGIDKFRAAVGKADQWVADKGDKFSAGIDTFRSSVGKADEWVATKGKDALEAGRKMLGAGASFSQQLIAGFEGWAAKAYPDAGKMAIGFGHQIKPGEEGLLGRSISKEEGQQLLEGDISKHEKAVRRETQGLGLNEKMIAALTSLHYNMGRIGDTMTEKLKSGDFEGAAKAFELYNRSEGKVSKGLISRRSQEQAEFLEGLRDLRSEQGQGNAGAQFHQETNINIHGAGDPQRVARAVTDEQARVNQSMTRNMQARTA